MEKIRIAHVAGGLTTGGVEAVIYNYFSHMNTEQYELVYISYDTPDPAVQSRFEALGFTVYSVTKKRDNFLKSCMEVFSILKKHRIQIVHSHMNLMCFVTNILGLLTGAKVRISHSHLAQQHGGWKKQAAGFCKWLDRISATEYFACSQDAGIYLFGQKAWDAGSVHILNNAIETGAFRYDPVRAARYRQELGLEDAVVIGNVGRFTEQKNQDFSLDIFREFRTLCPGSKLVLAGSGPDLERIRARTEEMGLQDAVLFPGSVTEPQKWYQIMDAFLFPSRYEGLGIVAVEAQAASLPVLASDVVPEAIVVSDWVEFLPLDASARCWAEALQRLIGRQDTRNHTAALTDALRRHHYDIETEVGMLDRFYKHALHGGYL